VIQDEVESQLSAMFDGELPATECELLSRRIDRDEILRARWSRYALIGAAMRSEPVATARSGFARRVSAALRGAEHTPRSKRGRKMILSAALSASLVLTVAGLSISLLRYTAADRGAGTVGAPVAAARADAAVALPGVAAEGLASIRRGSKGEPVSYVTPESIVGAHTALRTDLADFIVAHSEYSTPLMRRNLLSALVSYDDRADNASPGVSAPAAPASPAADALHAVTASASSR
jgi:sigma-E factor negative regulatory protein RseA